MENPWEYWFGSEAPADPDWVAEWDEAIAEEAADASYWQDLPELSAYMGMSGALAAASEPTPKTKPQDLGITMDIPIVPSPAPGQAAPGTPTLAVAAPFNWRRWWPVLAALAIGAGVWWWYAKR